MRRILVVLFSLVFLAVVGTVGVVGFAFWHYGRDLPDYRALADYQPAVTTRLYAGDGRMVTEYAIEKRAFVPIDAIPRRVIDAFLAAEDKNFYTHQGIDPFGLARAVVVNLRNYGSDRRPVGASTITQQVAKNFLLTNEVSVARKVKEAILAFRIEQTFTKDHILELYLNEIYLGYGSYGVAAAAVNYFNKSLDELTIAEAAYLAALPKAPNNYHPTRKKDAALERRNAIIGLMAENGYIAAADAQEAVRDDLVVRGRDETEYVRGADYFAEEVRREIVATYGEDALYKGGLSVRTTIEPSYQALAERSLRTALIAYDRRHGWRGPVTRIDHNGDWKTRLGGVTPPPGMPETWTLAVVLKSDTDALVGLSGGAQGTIPYSEIKWAREVLPDQRFGNPPRKAADAVHPGDVVMVEPLLNDKGEPLAGQYFLRQLPNVDGALVAIDPHTGRVLAMQGGFSTARSEFNRATQALRQPGSSFKPFVYLAALEVGYTPSTLILDAPFVYDQGPGLPKWKPKNYSGDFGGPSTLRTGIEKSRNLMTVRLAHAIGMERVARKAEEFGIDPKFPRLLAASLGAGETTLLRMATAYAMLANGGRRITPSLIDRIQDRNGKTIFRHDDRPCPQCTGVFWTNQDMPAIPDNRQQVSDPQSIYQMVHIMEGVVQRGTATRLSALRIPLAGKTGTTNDSIDTWFIGFTPDLVVGVFVGFDEPRTLGAKETGSSTALPAFELFMKEAMKGKAVRPFPVPRGIQFVRVNHDSGRFAMPGEGNVILEAFKTGERFDAATAILDGSAPLDAGDTSGLGPGDIYQDENGNTVPPGTPGAVSGGPQPQAGGLY